MSNAVSLIWDLLARDQASPAFLRVAGAADKAAASTAKATAGMDAAVAKMGAVGAKLTKTITLPVLAVGAAAVDQAAKFQKSMTLIQTAGGETAAKAEAIGKGLQKVSVDTATSLSQLGDGIYVVAKAGAQKWSATDQLLVMKAAAEGAKAENVDLGTATSALTTVMMSYHLSAKDAVTAENELIVGAGKAKTTMQEYAGALSTVVPIASAAGIKFDQVAGAIATLTQHGTSAQEATQELANTIRNLQNPNQVAIKSMQQLGLNVTDVEKNLGTRGLTGTIDLITTAIEKKMGPAGLVAVNAFKQSQSASADLNTMISKMPDNLAKLSQGFLTGKVSMKDYRTDIRDLGADSYAMGQQFLTLVPQAKGFNDLLKSGSPQALTFAGYLAKVMGGATGLNTALQLGGENMAYFNQATKAVGKAALDTGADVLGWNKTQDTLAVKMDKAKASLQVMAVEIGTALIPAVSKIADVVAKAVGWFENLSGTDKKIIGWSAVVLAALGPIVSIGGRLTAAVAGLASFAGAAESTASRVALSTQRIMGALAGIGLVYGSTQTGGTAGHLMGTIGGAITGASIGSFFGPIGTAVGGLTGAVAGLGLSFLHSGDSAKTASEKQVQAAQAAQQAIQNQKAAVDGLTTAIMNDNTRLQVENDLQKSGAFALAGQLGLSTKTLTDAVMGNVKAQQQIADLASKIATQPGLLGAGGAANTQLSQLNKLLGDEGINLNQAALAADQYAQANGKLNLAARSVAQQFALLGTSTNQATLAGKENLQFIDAHIAALLTERAQGKLTTATFDSQVASLKAQLTQYGYNTTTVDEFTAALKHVPAKVLTQIEKNGVTPAEIQTIIDRYGHIPTYKNTEVTATDRASATVRFIEQQLAELPTYKTITVTTVTKGNLQSTYNSQVPQKATGGSLPEGWSWVGDPGPHSELVHKQGSRVDVLSASASRLFAAAHGMQVPAFASGTSKSSALVSSLQTLIQGIGSAPSSPQIDLSNVTATRVVAQIQAAITKLVAAIKAGLSAKQADPLRNQIEDLAALARQELGSLKVKIDSTDLTTLRTALSGSADDIKTAFDQLVTDVKELGVPASRLNPLIASANKIADQLGAANQKLADDIAARAQEAQTIAQTINTFNIASDAFDLSTGASGGLAGVIGDLQKQVDAAANFGADLQLLKNMGLNDTSLRQLAEAGPTDAVMQRIQELLAAGPGQIQQINDLVQVLASDAGSVGDQLAGDLYDAGINADKGLIKGLQDKASDIFKAIDKIADAMVAELEKKLQIHSPSKVAYGIARFFGAGLERGLYDSHASVMVAAKSLANATVPKLPAASYRSGTGVNSELSEIRNELALLRSSVEQGTDRLEQASADNATTVGGHVGRAVKAAQTKARQH